MNDDNNALLLQISAEWLGRADFPVLFLAEKMDDYLRLCDNDIQRCSKPSNVKHSGNFKIFIDIQCFPMFFSVIVGKLWEAPPA